ncbi:Rho guanine nucleotide exchange factor 4 [Nymphon striatum]|nr:Rho guanine nucleotide exchange factor 4 [Nymphon striatum]
MLSSLVMGNLARGQEEASLLRSGKIADHMKLKAKERLSYIEECDIPNDEIFPAVDEETEETRLKAASAKLDKLIMGLPDSSVVPDSAIFSGEFSDGQQDQADWPNCSLPVCLNKTHLQPSKSISTLYSMSVTPTHRKERPLSEEYDERHFSDSDLKISNSYSNPDDCFSSSKDPTHLVPRYSSLRNKSQDSVLQKFKKSFSLRFHKNKHSDSSTTSSPSRSGKASRSESPSQFYYSLEPVNTTEFLPSSHPAAVSGISPMASRRIDMSSLIIVRDPIEHEQQASGLENNGNEKKVKSITDVEMENSFKLNEVSEKMHAARRSAKQSLNKLAEKMLRLSKLTFPGAIIDAVIVFCFVIYKALSFKLCTSHVSHVLIQPSKCYTIAFIIFTSPVMSSTSPDCNSLKVVPVVRRASCDERRSDQQKEIRNSKCNSADSGIQLELYSGANSSPCTQLMNVPSKPECSSPVLVRRRPVVVDRRKVKRPLSDLGGAIIDPNLLADIMKTELVIKDGIASVRRTQSDPANRDYDSSSSQSVDCKETSGISSATRTFFGNQLKRSSSQPLPSCKTTHPCFNPSPSHLGDHTSSKYLTSLDKECSLIQKNSQSHSFAEAVWDHVTLDPEELAFKAGDLVEVVDTTDENWWWGIMSKRCGWFPASFVWLKVNQEQSFEEFVSEPNSTLNTSTNSVTSQRTSVISVLNNDEIRTKIIHEIVASERDYVTHLKDVCEGYLTQVWKRPDMFSDEQVTAIFGNIEQIYSFQCLFLKHLESSIDWKESQNSQIGSCFLHHKEGFKIYSEYCNNHPQSSSVLQDLYTNEKYVQFFECAANGNLGNRVDAEFVTYCYLSHNLGYISYKDTFYIGVRLQTQEACRLLQDMTDISLDGFLLTPVQKICKYPLQLAELLNYTKTDHSDHSFVKEALETMKSGPNLIDSSSELIYTGEVNKLTTWSREVSLFLFDHQLVYCKRDLLKRNLYVYKGRINMDTCELTCLDESKDNHLGVKNAWKILCRDRNKTFVFFTRTHEEKEKWMKAFQKERERVREDKLQGFVITNKIRRQAISAAGKSKMNKRPKVKSMKSQGYLTGPLTKQSARSILNEDVHNAYLSQTGDSGIKSRTGSLPHGVSLSVNSCSSGVEKKKINQGTNSWFSFGSTKKLKTIIKN